MTQQPTGAQPTGAQHGTDPQNLSYEAARDQLVEVVRQLESGGVPLSESMALWQRGEQLAQVCQTWLDGARQTIAEARQGAAKDAPASARPSDPGADADE